MARFPSPLTIGECQLEALGAQRYDGLGVKIATARPILRIDTSGYSHPRPKQYEPSSRRPDPKETLASPPMSARDPHGRLPQRPIFLSAHPDSEHTASSKNFKHAPLLLRSRCATLSTDSIEHSHSELKEEHTHSESPIWTHLPEPRWREGTLAADSDVDSDVDPGDGVKVLTRVYATEIRITEVETRDGHKCTKTIIRPTSSSTSTHSSSTSSSSSAVSRTSKAKAGNSSSSTLSREVGSPSTTRSPITRLFSSRPSTTVTAASGRVDSSAQATPTMASTPSTARAIPPSSSSSSTAWRLPSLSLPVRKQIRRRSSQTFEEDVDYLQAKLEKEASGFGDGIRIEMQVEHSVIVEAPRKRRRHRERHRGYY